MISTVTNQGKARWMIIDDVFNADRLIEFLEALIKDAVNKIFLILDDLRVHHSKIVKAWLADHSDQIEVFYPPNYAPELNPDERLNADLKRHRGKGRRPHKGQTQIRRRGSHDNNREVEPTR